MTDQALAPPARAALLFFQVSAPDSARILRNRIPRPLQFARDRIEAADFPARMRLRRTVRHSGPDNNRVADDGWRRRDLVVGESHRADAESLAEIDDPLLAEPGNRLSGTGIERDESRVDRRDEDAAVAATLPRRDAAAHEVAVAHVARGLRVERPPLHAAHRIERDDAADRRADVDRSIDVERRRLERRRPALFRHVGVARAKRPGHLEGGDVLARDAIER